MILESPFQPTVFCDLEIKIMCEIRKKGQMQGNATEGSPIPLFPKSLRVMGVVCSLQSNPEFAC